MRAIATKFLPEVFIPQYWRVEPTGVVFYVDDYKSAALLANLDRLIPMPNGFTLGIKVRNGAPTLKLDAKIRERIKLAMEKRYNAMTKALDLTKFHADIDLQDIYCGLSRAPILIAVTEIICENIPNLEALNLDGNKIYTLEPIRGLLKKVPTLSILHLANNKVCKHFKNLTSFFFSFSV